MPSQDIIDELDDYYGNWVALVVKESDQYYDINKSLVKKLANVRNMRGIYITINKPFELVENSFRKNDVKTDNIYFVDMISRYMSKEPGLQDNCSFIDSPANLTMLAITFTQTAKMLQTLKGDRDQPIFIVVDSVNTFLVYNTENSVKKFFHFLVSKAREMGCKCVLLSSNVSDTYSLNRLLGDFSDRVINYGK